MIVWAVDGSDNGAPNIEYTFPSWWAVMDSVWMTFDNSYTAKFHTTHTDDKTQSLMRFDALMDLVTSSLSAFGALGDHQKAYLHFENASN